jgi:N6-adenosine-specific RNA methylase IME4
MPTFVNTDALDQLLLKRYCGKVGWGLAVELSPRRDSSRRVESLFTLVVKCQSDHTGEEESFAETVHNADANISL